MKNFSVTRIFGACVIFDFAGFERILVNPASPALLSETVLSKTGDKGFSGIIATDFGLVKDNFASLPETVNRLVPVVLPSGCGQWAKDEGFSSTIELKDGETALIGKARVTAAPAAPADGRFTAVIEANGLTIFFAGATLFAPLLGALPKNFPVMDIAFIPVGGPSLSASSRMKNIMSPQDAAGLCAVLSPRWAVPILYEDDPGAPEAFRTALKIFSPETRCKVLKNSEPVQF